MGRTKYTQYEDIKDLTYEQKLQVQKQFAKRANVRMKELEKHNIDYYAYEKAAHYLDRVGRKNNRFYEGKQFKDERELNIQLLNLTTFLNSKSSTVSGLRAINKKRLKTFRDKGIVITDEKKFFDFLSSKQFRSLGKLVDSNQIIDDFTKAMDEGFTANEIQAEYEEFLNSEMTFEQIDERRKGKTILK